MCCRSRRAEPFRERLQQPGRTGRKTSRRPRPSAPKDRSSSLRTSPDPLCSPSGQDEDPRKSRKNPIFIGLFSVVVTHETSRDGSPGSPRRSQRTWLIESHDGESLEGPTCFRLGDVEREGPCLDKWRATPSWCTSSPPLPGVAAPRGDRSLDGQGRERSRRRQTGNRKG